MGFERLLGNQRLKENLRASLSQGHVSHFYLISGPKGSGKHTLARLLGAAILCRGAEKPCLACPACRKVLAGTHPDFITVDDPEKKTVPVELIRQAREDVYIRPNEGERKIYLFPRAQDMGLPGQNALLKILEEPPEYGVFLLLTENPQRLLPTVRSRCTELAMGALPEATLRSALTRSFPKADPAEISAAIDACGGYLGQAETLLREGAPHSPETEALVRAVAERDPVGLLQVLVGMERWKRETLLPQLEAWLTLYESALLCRSGLKAVSPLAERLAASRSSRELTEDVAHFKKAMDYLQANVSPAAVCGFLEWALR